MSNKRLSIPEKTQDEIIFKCNNRCCICQTPFIHIHHIDEDPSNNDIDNLAPICPNCHSQAHSSSKLTKNLTAPRVKILRDKWYEYCDKRRDSLQASPNALLKLKNFVRSVGLPQYGWSKMFSALDLCYEKLTSDEIMNRVFATSNRDDIVTYLETVKIMFKNALEDESALKRFIDVCHAFGIDYEELS
jgi:hypothetical protein